MMSLVALKKKKIHTVYTFQHSNILWHLLNMKYCLKDPVMLPGCKYQMICASP